MADFAALPLFTDAWIADTAHLARAERGLYMDLIILLWRSPECRIPNDYDWIARKLRVSDDEKQTLGNIIAEFCQNDGNYITQKRLSKEYIYVGEKRQKQSERAKSRWNKEKDVCRGNAAPHGSGNAPSPSPSPTKTRDAREDIILKGEEKEDAKDEPTQKKLWRETFVAARENDLEDDDVYYAAGKLKSKYGKVDHDWLRTLIAEAGISNDASAKLRSVFTGGNW